jgi:hypothetical protein
VKRPKPSRSSRQFRWDRPGLVRFVRLVGPGEHSQRARRHPAARRGWSARLDSSPSGRRAVHDGTFAAQTRDRRAAVARQRCAAAALRDACMRLDLPRRLLGLGHERGGLTCAAPIVVWCRPDSAKLRRQREPTAIPACLRLGRLTGHMRSVGAALSTGHSIETLAVGGRPAKDRSLPSSLYCVATGAPFPSAWVATRR